MGSEWKGGRERTGLQDFWIVPDYIPSKNTANGGMIEKLLCK